MTVIILRNVEILATLAVTYPEPMSPRFETATNLANFAGRTKSQYKIALASAGNRAPKNRTRT